MKNKLILAVSILILLAAGVAVFRSYQISYQDKVSAAHAQQAADLVTEFGTHLKKVPLTANKDMLVPVIKKEYGPFLSAALLDRFTSDPTHAPGRQTSSPWPDRIEIKGVEDQGDVLLVDADIVNMTSTEVTKGGDAGRERISVTVSDVDGHWKITDYKTVEK